MRQSTPSVLSSIRERITDSENATLIGIIGALAAMTPPEEMPDSKRRRIGFGGTLVAISRKKRSEPYVWNCRSIQRLRLAARTGCARDCCLRWQRASRIVVRMRPASG